MRPRTSSMVCRVVFSAFRQGQPSTSLRTNSTGASVLRRMHARPRGHVLMAYVFDRRDIVRVFCGNYPAMSKYLSQAALLRCG